MAKPDTKKPNRRTSSTETLRAPPINPVGRLAAQTSGALQQVANSVVPNPVKLLSGDIDTLPIGDFILGDTTGMLDRWSKGRAPITFPAYGSKIVSAKFDPAIIDALGVVAPGAKPLMKVGIPLAKAGAKAAARNAAPMIDRMMVEKYGFPSLQPGIVKNPGGDWLEGPLSGFNRAIRSVVGPEVKGTPVDEVAAFNQKFRKMLTNYVKNDMGTAKDPIRMSIDRGISHYDVGPIYRPDYLTEKADRLGLPKGNLATTVAGRNWENLSDHSIVAHSVPGWNKFFAPGYFKERYPWIAAKDPNSVSFGLEGNRRDSLGDLGFDHMRDVLLDKYMAGEISPEQLRNLNMEKAVRIVHEANQAASAGAKAAEVKGYAANLLLPKSKEYPSGHFISELPDPATSDEAMALVNKIGCEGGWCTQKTGSAMDYGSNRSRLHTLFDSEGRPHVQFEVKKDISESPTNEEKVAVMKEMQRLGLTGTSKESRETYMQLYPEKVYTTIEQMKPPGNTWWSERGQEYLKRNPSYQNDLHVPMQDFVKSGKWDNVKDLDNAGLYKMSQTGMRPALEYRSIAQELGVTPEDIHEFHLSRPEDSSPYFTEKEFRDFINMQGKPPENFAKGGKVGHPNKYVEKVQNWGRRGQMYAADKLGIGDEVKFASTIPERYYPASEQHNGPGDAMRHILLQAQLRQKYGELPAKAVGWGHELVGTIMGETPSEKTMDDFNDALGRKIGSTAKDKADMTWQAMQAIKSGEAHTIQHPEEDNYAEGGLVHSEFNFDEINHYAEGGIVAHNDFNYGEISKMADQLVGSMYG